MLRSQFALAGSIAFVAAINPSEAHAVELGDIGGQTASVDITNTAALSYHFDNRNTDPGKVETRLDDDYGDFVDRLNVQGTWWRFTLGLRLDAWAFVDTLSRDGARGLANAEPSDPGLTPNENAKNRNNRTNDYLGELHSRYLNTFYPAKLWVGYNQPGLDITVGDFYAQLGRGLVLSVRKIDELSIDTTVRGAKVVVDHDFGPLRLGATLLGGVMNPSRVDEVSGRRLHGESSPLFFAFPRAGDFETYDFDAAGQPTRLVETARPSYLADRMLGAHLEGGNDAVQLGLNGSLLLRTSYAAGNARCAEVCDERDLECKRLCDDKFPVFSGTNPTRSHDTIRTFGGSVNIPSIAKHGDLYLEVVGQQLRNRQPGASDLSGYAVYLSGSARSGPFTATLEGKHNRTFFPLSANVDVLTSGSLAPEFDVVAYSQPPTAEPTYVEAIGSPNVCVTGGRGRIDYRFAPTVAAYAWVGHYISATEVNQLNLECAERNPNVSDKKRDDERTRTWDAAVGSELDFEQKKSHVRAWFGVRTTDRLEPAAQGDGSTTFYREGYLRYDIVKHLGGPFSLQAQGVHRRRYEPIAFDVPWTEGENYTALQWAPHFSFIFGYEYLARANCRPSDPSTDLCHYLSGGLQWRAGSSERVAEKLFDSVNLFVGQRRGAVRCVSGVCRFFPPFEGARLEIVSRF